MSVTKTKQSIYEKDYEKLLKLGKELVTHYSNYCSTTKTKEQRYDSWAYFIANYQYWYSEALTLIKTIFPERLVEFQNLYERNNNRKEITISNYTIEDALDNIAISRGGHTICSAKNVFSKFQRQFLILHSIKQIFISSLFSLKEMLQADLFDSDIEAAANLNKKGFHRAAGAMCGVVIEKHLNEVCTKHNIILKKKDPTINDFNDTLKTNNVYDISGFRKIQYLGDIRNKCDHNKKSEPTREEVEELINGTSWLIKNIF